MIENEFLPAIVNELTPMDLFKKENMDGVIDYVRTEAKKHKPDVSTKKGRDAIKSNSHMVSKSKTALVKIGTVLMAKKKADIKAFNEVMKMMKDDLDYIRDETRIKVTEFEETEKVREAELAEIMTELERGVEFDATAEQMKSRMDELAELDYPEFFTPEDSIKADEVKLNTLNRIKEVYQSQLQIEKDKTELAELKKKDAAREQKEADDKRAKQIAQDDIDKANKKVAAAEKKTKDAEDRAEQDRINKEASEKREADAKATREQEDKDRIAKKKKDDEEAEAKKANNLFQVMRSIYHLNIGITTEQATKIVTAIDEGKIPGASIKIIF